MSNTRRAPKKATSAGGWKKSHTTLELPSGNCLEAKNPGIMGLAHKGLVPNSLMTVMMDSVKKGREPKMEEIFSDNIDIDDMISMMEKAVIEVAVNPKILPVPLWTEEDALAERCKKDDVGKEAPRDADALYIDDVSDDDKQFIFGWVTGGTTNLEQFRAERAQQLASLSGQPALED